MSRNERLLAHVTAGQEGGVEVVLIHAFPLDGRMWEPVLEWARTDGEGRVRATAVDLPGFGQSPLGDEAVEGLPMTGMTAASESVVVTMNELGIETAIVVGCSMGGYVGFQLFRNHRDRVAGVLFTDTKATADDEEARKRRADTIALVEEKGVHALADVMLGALLGKTTLETRPGVVQNVSELIEAQSVNGVTAALRGLAAREDSTDLLTQIDVPVTVLVGEEDTITPPEVARDMADAIFGADYVVVPGAGHLPAMEDPSKFIAALEGVIERVASGTTR